MIENDLVALLKIEAQEIDTAFKKAQIEGKGTPQEVADRREEAVKKFLERFFPFPYRIAKGNIIDSFSARSNSIDVLIINPVHPHTIITNSEKYSVIFADGVDAAIEVKPRLEGEELERALSQGISVKKLTRKESPYIIKRKFSESRLEASKRIPYCIFSNKTYSNTRTLLENIVAYYEENRTPPEYQFDIICINNEYLIINIHTESLFNIDGDNIGLFIDNQKENTLAAFLWWLNVFPGATPILKQPIISYYLARSDELKEHYDDLDYRLSSIKNRK